jgi:transposase InsO family protein
MQMVDERTGGTSTIYFIAFLDDAPRFIMHYRLIADTGSETYAAVLADTFQVWALPWVRGSDNGGELTGAALTSFLRQYGVTPWRTTRYTPQQNGKRGVSGEPLTMPETASAPKTLSLVSTPNPTTFGKIKLSTDT